MWVSVHQDHPGGDRRLGPPTLSSPYLAPIVTGAWASSCRVRGPLMGARSRHAGLCKTEELTLGGWPSKVGVGVKGLKYSQGKGGNFKPLHHPCGKDNSHPKFKKEGVKPVERLTVARLTNAVSANFPSQPRCR